MVLRREHPTSSPRVIRLDRPNNLESGCDPEYQRLIRELGSQKTFRARSAIFFEGEPAQGVYLITSGTVRCFRITVDGRRQIARFLNTDDDMALTAFKTYDYTAEAVTAVELLCCSRGRFEAALRENPDLRKSVFERISGELVSVRDQMVLLGQMTAAERAATFLLTMASQSAGPDGELYLPMTRQDIADYLGMKLETVSRMFHNLRRAGIIEMPAPNRIRIRDEQQLATLAAA